MLNQFLEKINDKIEYFKNFLENNKKNLKNIFFGLSFLIVLLFVFDVNIISLNNFLSFGLKPENFFYLILNGNIIFISYVIFFLKMTLLNFFLNTPLFLFFDWGLKYMYLFNLNLYYFFNFFGFSNLKFFENYILSINEFNFNCFEFDYLRTKNFKKIIILNSNLPIFFYFLVLFLFTTIISFIFLSYLGLYGVFFINFITIIFF